MAEPSHLFEQRLRQRCVDGLSRSVGFAALLDFVEGADPLAALAALREIADTQPQLAACARGCIEDARTLHDLQPFSPELPIVHPLDYHWRFSPATIECLLERAGQLSRPGETVLFLGTPSLYRRAADLLLDRRCILLDRDARIIEACPPEEGAEALVVDLLADPLPELDASCAIADPPWYPEAIFAFAHAAGQMLQRTGTLLLGFPAQLTRPGVSAERADFLASARRLGFDPLDHDPLAVRYETPSFEFAAMGAAGLPSPPKEWRRGDLLTFELRRLMPASPPGVSAEEEWSVHQIEQIPLRARSSAPASGSELIGTLVEGDILPSVSRRAPVRAKAALWTSRNRIFSSSDPPRLARVLAAVEAGNALSSVSERRMAAELQALVALERDEHGLAVPVLATLA